jgi:hypothetical protein
MNKKEKYIPEPLDTSLELPENIGKEFATSLLAKTKELHAKSFDVDNFSDQDKRDYWNEIDSTIDKARHGFHATMHPEYKKLQKLLKRIKSKAKGQSVTYWGDKADSNTFSLYSEAERSFEKKEE